MNKLIKQAFTLIELLIVIAIIGILSGLIVVSMSGVTQKANIAKAQVFSNSLRNSLMSNIVGEWKFDIPVVTDRLAIDSDVIDTWGGVNNGNVTTLAGHQPTLTSSNCIGGSCLSFDGSDDYVEINDTISLRPSQLSLAVWFKSALTDRSIIAKPYAGGSWSYGFHQSVASLIFLNLTASISCPLQLNTWTYAVATHDGTNLL